MKDCPFCREEIKDEALKCRYCGSSLVDGTKESSPSLSKSDLEPNQVLLVIDRGFLYFAKFVIGIVVVVIAFATAYFGFDLNKARESADETRNEIQKTQQDILDARKSMQDDIDQSRRNMLQVTQEAQTLLADAQQKSAETQAKLDELLTQGQRESSQLHLLALGVVVPSPSGDQSRNGAETKSTSFSVPQIAALYSFPKELNGSGQTIGFIELGGGFRDTDIDAYFAQLKLHRPKVIAVSVDHGANKPTGDPNGADGQVMLDIEVAGAIAPAANVVVYFAPNTDAGFLDAITTAIHDTGNHPSVISISWGASEGAWTPQARTALDNALKQAASRAITVVGAAGDAGATDGLSDGRPHVGFPASSPWVLAVGGTSLSGAGTSIASEVVWNGGPNAGATGGGVSEVFVLPDWQADAKVPRRQDKTAGRGVPDVAASADPRAGYRVRIDSQESVLGGTAAAAPLWAGLIAILNQGIGKNLGYINPLLYRSIGPQSVLRPIVQGNNSSPSVQGYSAAPGWNAVGGWGTPDGRKLLDWLRAHRTEF